MSRYRRFRYRRYHMPHRRWRFGHRHYGRRGKFNKVGRSIKRTSREIGRGLKELGRQAWIATGVLGRAAVRGMFKRW
jgi:hypothetical protein